ncbi:uncharacterized protein BX664DRAFT_339601 [Halteromyces radiatus]|uniref:uncharacterized protein n=1 Tax=Halteromyces radiatus TaxID=101107 RepID=UPI002220C6CF|nr:uncharacterized protein BX664DRAFT_339601 [Halteromyces radiatus]KAI8083012.1 hypothetical protein BX664DRAFT_339601 [Halteromyces radiatus]
MKYSDTLSPDNYTLELAANRALIAFSCLAFLLANGCALKFKNFLPSAHFVVASFSYLAYYVLTEVNYTIINDEGVYLLIFYISLICEYLGRLAVWLAAIEVFRLNPRQPLIWIFPYLMYLLGLGMFGVQGICYVVLGIVQMVLNATTPPIIVDCIAKSRLVALYLFWPFVGSVFLLFFFYRKTLNHFYGTFIFYYLCLVPGILVLTIDENILSKTDQSQVRVAYIAEFVCYRLIYLFAIGWGSLFASQWAKSKEIRDKEEVTADVVDIDIDDFDEKTEENTSHRHLAV